MGGVLRRPGASMLGVLVLSAMIIAVPAGRRPFWSSDEARFALLAQDVVDHGRWLVAELRGRYYLNKPQLFFWAVAAAALPFGRVTEASAALPALVSSLCGVAGVMAIGRLLWGWQAGAVAGLILVTTPLYFEMGHQVLPDGMLNAWLVWALYWLLRAERAGWPLPPVLAFYGCLTAALLSKGPQALAALAAAGVAVALTDGSAELRKLRPALGFALMFGVTAIVWLAPYYVRSVGGFDDQVLRGHYVTWYLLGPVLPRLTAFYAPLPAFLPWTLFLVAAPFWWRQSPDAGRRRIALWTVTLWVLIAVSGNYRSRYMLVIFPGLALLTAEFLTARVTGRAQRALNRASLGCAVFVVAAAAVMLSPLVGAVENEDRAYIPDSGWEQAAIVILALAACVALVRGVRLGAPVAGAVGLALAMAGILLVEGVAYPIRYTRAFDVRPLAAAAAANVPPGGTVVGYPDLRLSYDFYLRRRVVEIKDEASVRDRLATVPRDAFIMTADRWHALAPTADSAWRVLASATLRERPMVVVGRTPR
jgi:4-amino-4-deoxy-L-arabinose transferase-like glycosyltransferase